MATVISEIYEEVRSLAPDLRGGKLVLRVNPQVARALDGEEADARRCLAGLTGGEVLVEADPLLHQEQFDVVVR